MTLMSWMIKSFVRVLIVSVLALLVLAGCGGENPTPDPSGDNNTPAAASDPAADAVTNYLTSKVSNNDERLRSLLCAEKEADFIMESSSFDSVTEARIENMACASQGEGLVTCTGRIVATYGPEDLVDFELGTYRVVEEDGVWKWCGETAAAAN